MHYLEMQAGTDAPRRRSRTARHALSAAALGAAALTMSLVAAAAIAGPALASETEGTTWLCKPGLVNDPCLSSEEATVEFGNGASFVEHARPQGNPPIDCFYVYPTVSSQVTDNANLEIDPEETQIAIQQASRFSQVCKVYAPMYPQITVPALIRSEFGHPTTLEDLEIAYGGVLSAWREYLAKDNHGRGVVLIGHSQGAGMLIHLMREQIDPNASERRLLVSALIMGGNVLVPVGKTVGGELKHIPACQFAWEPGCVVAYSSFLEEPPANALFARPESPVTLLSDVNPAEFPGTEVLCVNPTLFFQDDERAGPLLSYYGTTAFPGFEGPFVQTPSAPTPWVATPGQYSAQCEHAGNATWLQVTDVGPAGDPREKVREALGPQWGTHLEDINLALGNLVPMVAAQTFAYLFERRW